MLFCLDPMDNEKKLKICYMLPTINVGGAERHVIGLAAGLRQRNFDAQIVSIFHEGALAGEIKKNGIPFSCLNAPRGWGLGALLAIYRRLSQNPVDILHTYLFGFHGVAGFPARLLKIPVLISSRREIAEWRKARHEWIENLGNCFVDKVVCCSQAVREWTLDHERISAQKTLTIYNGIDQKRFESGDGLKIRREFNIPDEASVIGTVANFAPEKGYPYLLEMTSQVLEAYPQAWFLIVGSGPLEEEIKQKAKGLPHSNRILFAGSRPDVPDLISAMNVFVLASVREGFPNVLLEAMGLGKPVVATRVGGIPELIDAGRNGILVPPRDAQALAKAVIHGLKDPLNASRLGNEARRTIRENFSLDRMVNQYETFYRSLIKTKGIHESSPKEGSVMNSMPVYSER